MELKCDIITVWRMACVFACQATSVYSYFTSCILSLQWDMFGPAFFWQRSYCFMNTDSTL